MLRYTAFAEFLQRSGVLPLDVKVAPAQAYSILRTLRAEHYMQLSESGVMKWMRQGPGEGIYMPAGMIVKANLSSFEVGVCFWQLLRVCGGTLGFKQHCYSRSGQFACLSVTMSTAFQVRSSGEGLAHWNPHGQAAPELRELEPNARLVSFV